MPVPRYKTTRWPALFSMGFRPFFLCAGLWAAGAMVLWLFALWRGSTLLTLWAPSDWHAHEMLFGFVVAAIAGFLLTAIPNWTGRLPLQGMPLAGLVLLWCGGRIAMGFSAWIGAAAAAVIDTAFLAVLFAVVLREVLAGRNWRNLPVVAAILLLLAANALVHMGVLTDRPSIATGFRLAVAVIVMLVSLIGGRVVPSFTGNWLRKAGAAQLPAPFGVFDKLVLTWSGLALAGWVVLPEARLVALGVGIAGVLHGARLARWGGLRTGAEPLVWVLHLGYGWLALGLVLLAAGSLWPALGASAAMHALTTGAMGTMILAIMTRATLGHTGRVLAADAATVAAYLLISLAAVLRVGSGLSGFPFEMQIAAGLCWGAAFVLFLLRYGPMYVVAARTAT
ncbi:MAG: short-chain dehydrogenase [Alphaproteobacteria bacterium]|nr:short-chain dehydrogenase [Alphaproteobacteria bacterium]